MSLSHKRYWSFWGQKHLKFTGDLKHGSVIGGTQVRCYTESFPRNRPEWVAVGDFRSDSISAPSDPSVL